MMISIVNINVTVKYILITSLKRRRHKQFKTKYRRELHFIKKKIQTRYWLHSFFFFYRIWWLGNIIGNQQSTDIALITYSCILEKEPIQSSFYKLKTENRKEANKGNANSYFILYYITTNNCQSFSVIFCLFWMPYLVISVSKSLKTICHCPRVYDSKWFERLREGCIHDLCIVMSIVCDRFYLWYYLVIQFRGII